MDRGLRVLVVIPAYNEEENILDTVRSVQGAGYDYVVVNDGSKDSTLEICRRNGINVLDLPQNLGIGGAVQAGHKYALKFGYDVDVQVDGDGQHDPKYIDRLISGIRNGADLVVGSRFLDNDEGFQSTFLRRVGIKWLSKLLMVFTGKTITDPTSGFRASGSNAIRLFCDYYPDDYPEPESIACAIKAGLIVKESSVSMNERQGGTSSIKGFSSIYYMVKVSVAIVLACLWNK